MSTRILDQQSTVVYIPDQEPLQKAFDYYNCLLFNDELPHVTIVPVKCTDFVKGKLKDSIENPDFFLRKLGDGTEELFFRGHWNSEEYDEDPIEDPEMAVITTSIDLVHDMIHLWQISKGKGGARKVTHDNEWAEKAEELGLASSSKEDKRQATGNKVALTITGADPFSRALDALRASGFQITWQKV